MAWLDLETSNMYGDEDFGRAKRNGNEAGIGDAHGPNASMPSHPSRITTVISPKLGPCLFPLRLIG